METTLLIVLIVLVIVTVLVSVRIIQQGEKGVVMRLGRFHAIAEPGLNFLIPYLDTMIKVDVRERVINVEPQKVITKDNVTVVVDAVIYYKVIDPVKAEFEVEDFDLAATTLAQTNLRNLIGDKTLDETLTARDLINTNLRDVLDEATHGWGVKVTRVEVQKIDPPAEITEAMSLQMKAEREKRATILTAEGQKQSQLLQAEGEAQAKIIRAKADADSIKLVAESANKYFTKNAQEWQKLLVSREVLAHNTKYVIPTSAELVNILNLEGDAKIVPVAKK